MAGVDDQPLGPELNGASRDASSSEDAQRHRTEADAKPTKPGKSDTTVWWEFKILRSVMGRFRKREYLLKVMEGESRAGWVLLEKLSDGRVRVKRPTRAKAYDASLDIDP